MDIRNFFQKSKVVSNKSDDIVSKENRVESRVEKQKDSKKTIKTDVIESKIDNKSELKSKKDEKVDATANRKTSSKRLSGDDFELLDSDDDDKAKQSQRKRLRPLNSKSPSKSPKKVTSILDTDDIENIYNSVDIKKDNKKDSKTETYRDDKRKEKEENIYTIDLCESSSDNKSLRKSDSTINVISDNKIESKPNKTTSSLKPLNSNPNRKEVKGGAAAFFSDTNNTNDVNTQPESEIINIIDKKTVISPNTKGKLAINKSEDNIDKISCKVDNNIDTQIERKIEKSFQNKIDEKIDSKSGMKVTPKKSPVKKSPIPIKKSSDLLDSSDTINNKKFVITGQFINYTDREALEELILELGGKVNTAVSGKTDYLLAGHILEDGRPTTEGSKYKAAIEKKVKIINEEEFLKLMSEQRSNESIKIDIKEDSHIDSELDNKRTSKIDKKIDTKIDKKVDRISDNKTNSDGQLWVDKYRPLDNSQVIGSKDVISKLSEWLSKWEAVHLKKSLKIPYNKENPGSKAVLLSGPPGVGKTTLASLIAHNYGYEILELNASDTRNKKSVSEQLSEAIGSTVISFDHTKINKRIIVMDEVDGMSGNNDRGGVPELISLIKKSKIPIICICNDRQSPKIRSLANACYDIRVKRPTKTQIAQRMIQIAKDEGLQIDTNAAELLVEQSGNDIRQVLHAMQMWKSSSSSIGYTDLKHNLNRIEKDKILRQTPFDACLSLLNGGKNGLSTDERYNSFFIDYSLLPLMIQQNYIDAAKGGIFKNPNLSDSTKMSLLSSASDAASDMDLAGSRLMGDDQHWELLPTQAIFSVRVGSLIQGFQAFPNFPAWLGKNSSKGKMSRLTHELVNHTCLSINQNFLSMRLDYVPYLRDRLLSILLSNDDNSNPIDDVIALLDSYGLSKDDFMETFHDLSINIPNHEDKYNKIDSKLKSLLTRTFNSMNHSNPALIHAIDQKFKKGKGKVNNDDDNLGIEDEEDVYEEEPEEDDVDISNYQKKSKTTTKKTTSSKENSSTTTKQPNKKAKK